MFCVVLNKGKDKREEIINARSMEDANKKAEAMYKGYIAARHLTFKVG